MLEKGWNPRVPADTLSKDFIEIHPTDSRCKIMLDEMKHHEKQSINDTFEYEKQKWDKSHKVPDLKLGHLFLASALKFNNIKGPKKLKYSYVEYLVIFALHVTNGVQVKLSDELENEHPTLPVSFIQSYQPFDKQFFPLTNPAPLTLPQVEQNEDKKMKKFVKERRLMGKNQREYVVRYRNLVHEDEWLEELEIPDLDEIFRRFVH
ncbi:hypothetical protein O181_068392 [Austropuccinia psidii MF-1]|uniref:Uncharacterized protein n=1 Tax=Austropuccinia psidii MF-1 TaxID=1389203 RepID=A0A9Q3F2D7_9BASI|nr:hypothetical protein [Austropuccinia psidii MF-1]